MSFNDKVILITGASSGIGADAARHLAKLGGKIALIGRNEPRLNEVAEQIKASKSPEPLVIVADVTKDAKRIIEQTISHFGQLDILVNNAGVSHYDSITSVDMDAYDRLMNTNIRSIIVLTQLAIPHLEPTKGNILNVSSSAGLSPTKGLFSYSLTKSALNQFTKSAALDLASKGIRVNAINPVAIRTPIFINSGLITQENSDGFFEQFKHIYPVGRVGEVHDTSNAIEFLIKDSSSFLTGILLPVDGGALTGQNCNVKK